MFGFVDKSSSFNRIERTMGSSSWRFTDVEIHVQSSKSNEEEKSIDSIQLLLFSKEIPEDLRVSCIQTLRRCLQDESDDVVATAATALLPLVTNYESVK